MLDLDIMQQITPNPGQRRRLWREVTLLSQGRTGTLLTLFSLDVKLQFQQDKLEKYACLALWEKVLSEATARRS